MKKMNLAVAVSFVCCTLLLSCKKDIAKDATVAEVDSRPNQNIKHCNITYMEGQTVYLSTHTYTFTYNHKGDPTLILPGNVGTGQPKLEFRYDNKGRLTDLIGAYNNGFFEFWHEYGYDNKNRIITDSLYYFGTYGDDPLDHFSYRGPVTNYEYDAQERIKKTFYTYPFAPGIITDVVEYNYDANGNLIRPGVTYDNKISFLRTHELWMFLERDYSMNNSIMPASYNPQGLPTSFAIGATNNFFLHVVVPVTKIEYDCKGNAHNN